MTRDPRTDPRPGDDPFYHAACSLAALLKDEPWYHRTTMRGPLPRLAVWAEAVNGVRPQGIPYHHHGYPVTWNRVDNAHPCPFGSVRPNDEESRRILAGFEDSPGFE